MGQTTPLSEQDKSQQTGNTEVSQAQPTVGRFAEIPNDQFTERHPVGEPVTRRFNE